MYESLSSNDRAAGHFFDNGPKQLMVLCAIQLPVLVGIAILNPHKAMILQQFSRSMISGEHLGNVEVPSDMIQPAHFFASEQNGKLSYQKLCAVIRPILQGLE